MEIAPARLTSLGDVPIRRARQLHLMTAGQGVAHADETRAYRGPVHRAQLWVAQPEATRHGPPAFEQRRHLPVVDFGQVSVTLLCGEPFPETVSMWWNFVARTHDESMRLQRIGNAARTASAVWCLRCPAFWPRGDPGPGNELGKLERCSN